MQKKGLRFGNVNPYLHYVNLHMGVAHNDNHHHYDNNEERDDNHVHADGIVVHNHVHHHHVREFPAHSAEENEHREREARGKNKEAAWGLVAILGLTPCIALLPLTFAAVKCGTVGVILVNLIFAAGTIITILLLTWLRLVGLSCVKLGFSINVEVSLLVWS